MQPDQLDYAGPLTPTVPRQPRIWLVVAAILAMLLFIVMRFSTYTDRGSLEDARNAAARSDVTSFRISLDRFRTDTGRYPTTLEGLNALVTFPGSLPGWKGPYVFKMKADPWRTAYIYHGDNPTSCRILSAGPDCIEGTADDIK